VEIDTLAKTQSGKVIAGECKYTNTKVNKAELTKLKEKCQLAGIEADIFVFFSKRGFSHELLSLKSSTLLLYDADDFNLLLQEKSPNEKL